MIIFNTFIIIISGTLGYLGAWFIGTYGIRIGIIDVPSERSSHVGIVPKGGGIGILAAFVMCAIFLKLPASFWIPGACLAIVSFCGDKFEIRPKYRLIIHFFCCIVFLIFHFNSLNSNFVYYILVFPFAVFIAGTLNFYNFMDGINGIAGITGFVGFILLALFGLSSGTEIKYLILCCALSLACVGFLPFNIPHAKVFMGDIGSILIGFVFACLMITMSQNLTHFMVAISFLMPFYADELSTMVVRIRNSEDLTVPHRKHIYQLLANELDIKHWIISVGYGVIQLLIGLMVLATMPHGFLSVMVVVVGLFLTCVFISNNVRERI